MVYRRIPQFSVLTFIFIVYNFMFHFKLLLFFIISTYYYYLNPKLLTYFVFKRQGPLRALEPNAIWERDNHCRVKYNNPIKSLITTLGSQPHLLCFKFCIFFCLFNFRPNTWKFKNEPFSWFKIKYINI